MSKDSKIEWRQKIAAKRIGVTFEEYIININRGLKWCTLCRDWHKKDLFSKDSSRGDGLSSSCRKSRNKKSATKQPLLDLRPVGRRFTEARNGDKVQARGRVNHLVKIGALINPNKLPCFDCNHIGDDRRHEYDHYLGYDAENHEKVQVVCSVCHHKRDGLLDRSRDESGRYV